MTDSPADIAIVGEHSAVRDELRTLAMVEQAPECMREDVRCWVAALRGEGRRPSPPLQWSSIRCYLTFALPTLHDWSRRARPLSEITREDVEHAIRDHSQVSAHNVHTALRSLFRGLKRERRLSYDPATGVVAHFTRRMPRPLPRDRLAGLIDRLLDPRERLVVGLVAVYALRITELRDIRLDDLDRSDGTLRISRAGLVCTFVLDEFILELANAWVRHRSRRWPHSANPYLFVSSRTAAASTSMSHHGLTSGFRRISISARRLRIDRILDEARHTADPAHLTRVLGLGVTTAVRYVQAAHPHRFQPDPAAD